MTTPYTLPEPFYRHGSGDIPSYGASQLKAAFASGAASKEFDIRGKLASSLKCWHRLSADEANELIAFAASRDAALEELEQDYSAKCNELELVHSELDAVRADAASWRKYKARKDAVIAAGMGCNPLRTESQRKSDAFDSLPDDYEVN